MEFLDIWNIPKAELHVHLDGSLRAETLLELLGDEVPFGAKTPIELAEAIRFQKGMDLKDCLARFGITLSVLQTQANVERVAFELAEDLHRDNVKYAEVRFCPTLHTNQGFTPQLIFNSVHKGLRLAYEKYGIDSRVIFCCIRERPIEDAWEILELAERNKPRGVVAIDLAGNEYDYPPELSREIYEHAGKVGLKKTVHAGEGTTAESIEKAITVLGADRISHGLTVVKNKKMMEMVRESGVTLEFCPTSNIHTGSIQNYGEHVARRCFDFGIKCTANLDNRLFSATTTSKEYYMLAISQGLSLEDVSQMNRYAFNAKFSSTEGFPTFRKPRLPD